MFLRLADAQCQQQHQQHQLLEHSSRSTKVSNSNPEVTAVINFIQEFLVINLAKVERKLRWLQAGLSGSDLWSLPSTSVSPLEGTLKDPSVRDRNNLITFGYPSDYYCHFCSEVLTLDVGYNRDVREVAKGHFLPLLSKMWELSSFAGHLWKECAGNGSNWRSKIVNSTPFPPRSVTDPIPIKINLSARVKGVRRTPSASFLPVMLSWVHLQADTGWKCSEWARINDRRSLIPCSSLDIPLEIPYQSNSRCQHLRRGAKRRLRRRPRHLCDFEFICRPARTKSCQNGQELMIKDH